MGEFSHKFSIAPSGETTARIKKKLGGAKMGRTSSITVPSMVGILGRETGCRRKSVMFVLLPAGLRVAQPCRYCFYSLAQKWVFRPERATRCPDKRKSWHGSVRSPLPTFTFIGAKMWEYSPQNCQNFEFWPEICTSGATIFSRNSQRLYASIGSF